MLSVEGLKKEDGTPVVDPIYKTDRAVYYGDVSAHLANLVIKRLGIKPGMKSQDFVEEHLLPGSLL